MMRSLELLRERIERAPTNRRGCRQYGRQLQIDIKAYAASRLAQGANYKQIAETLGMADSTLVHWCQDPLLKKAREGQPMGFRPVEVRDERSDSSGSASGNSDGFKSVSQPIVVLPSGVRVEGISLAELPGFLERLGCR